MDKAVLLRSRPPAVDTLLPGTVRDSLAVLVVIHTLVTRSFFAVSAQGKEGRAIVPWYNTSKHRAIPPHDAELALQV